MKKFLIKGIVIVIFVVLVIWICFKVYHYVIIHNVYHAIENFISEKNRYYSVITIQNRKILSDEQILYKDNQIKYMMLDENLNILYGELRNFNENHEMLRKSEFRIESSNFLTNIPNFISLIYQNNKFNLDQFLQIYQIIPIQYKDTECYKIVTKTETLLIDKNTYLPVYAYRNLKSSEKSADPNKEYIYEFRVNTVTQEDMEER